MDMENGTYRLAWTQSITRGRWLLGKLGLPVAAAGPRCRALTLLFTWWRAPNVHINGRLDTGATTTPPAPSSSATPCSRSPSPSPSARFWRRAAASLTVAFIGYFAARILVDYALRDHLVAPLKATYKGAQQPSFLYNAHVISSSATLNGKQIMSMHGGGGFLGAAMYRRQPPGIGKAVFHIVYQPESHFWPLQLTETGLFAGIAAILILFRSVVDERTNSLTRASTAGNPRQVAVRRVSPSAADAAS